MSKKIQVIFAATLCSEHENSPRTREGELKVALTFTHSSEKLSKLAAFIGQKEAEIAGIRSGFTYAGTIAPIKRTVDDIEIDSFDFNVTELGEGQRPTLQQLMGARDFVFSGQMPAPFSEYLPTPVSEDQTSEFATKGKKARR